VIERRRRVRRVEDVDPASGLVAFAFGVLYGILLAAAFAAWVRW
jgi:hypothetical protein